MTTSDSRPDISLKFPGTSARSLDSHSLIRWVPFQVHRVFCAAARLAEGQNRHSRHKTQRGLARGFGVERLLCLARLALAFYRGLQRAGRCRNGRSWHCCPPFTAGDRGDHHRRVGPVGTLIAPCDITGQPPKVRIYRVCGSAQTAIRAIRLPTISFSAPTPSLQPPHLMI
jgi:hypothetical protein